MVASAKAGELYWEFKGTDAGFQQMSDRAAATAIQTQAQLQAAAAKREAAERAAANKLDDLHAETLARRLETEGAVHNAELVRLDQHFKRRVERAQDAAEKEALAQLHAVEQADVHRRAREAQLRPAALADANAAKARLAVEAEQAARLTARREAEKRLRLQGAVFNAELVELDQHYKRRIALASTAGEREALAAMRAVDRADIHRRARDAQSLGARGGLDWTSTLIKSAIVMQGIRGALVSIEAGMEAAAAHSAEMAGNVEEAHRGYMKIIDDLKRIPLVGDAGFRAANLFSGWGGDIERANKQMELMERNRQRLAREAESKERSDRAFEDRAIGAQQRREVAGLPGGERERVQRRQERDNEARANRREADDRRKQLEDERREAVRLAEETVRAQHAQQRADAQRLSFGERATTNVPGQQRLIRQRVAAVDAREQAALADARARINSDFAARAAEAQSQAKNAGKAVGDAYEVGVRESAAKEVARTVGNFLEAGVKAAEEKVKAFFKRMGEIQEDSRRANAARRETDVLDMEGVAGGRDVARERLRNQFRAEVEELPDLSAERAAKIEQFHAASRAMERRFARDDARDAEALRSERRSMRHRMAGRDLEAELEEIRASFAARIRTAEEEGREEIAEELRRNQAVAEIQAKRNASTAKFGDLRDITAEIQAKVFNSASGGDPVAANTGKTANAVEKGLGEQGPVAKGIAALVSLISERLQPGMAP